jgi:hypothetical protein
MLEKADFLLIMHTQPEPPDKNRYVWDLIEHLGISTHIHTSVSSFWERENATDRELLEAAKEQWLMPFADGKRFRAETLDFVDQDGKAGRMFLAANRGAAAG